MASRHTPIPLGTVFGLWEVVGPPEFRSSASSNGRQTLIPVRCACGATRVVLARSLRAGVSTSCGCAQKGIAGQRHLHGASHSRLYNIWQKMKDRCTNPAFKQYKDYGGRGISVCPEWSNDFPAFQSWALSAGYEDVLQIDRIDNDGGYEPSNCRWVTSSMNHRNTRVSKMLNAFGETKALPDWADDSRCVVGRGTLESRIRRGWSAEKAMTESASYTAKWHGPRVETRGD